MFGVEFSVISSIFSSSYRKFLHCILPHLPVSVPLCVVHLCVFTTPCGYFSHLLFYFEVICLYCVMFNFTYPSCLMVFDYLYLSLVVFLPFNSLITFLCINTVHKYLQSLSQHLFLLDLDFCLMPLGFNSMHFGF